MNNAKLSHSDYLICDDEYQNNCVVITKSLIEETIFRRETI